MTQLTLKVFDNANYILVLFQTKYLLNIVQERIVFQLWQVNTIWNVEILWFSNKPMVFSLNKRNFLGIHHFDFFSLFHTYRTWPLRGNTSVQFEGIKELDNLKIRENCMSLRFHLILYNSFDNEIPTSSCNMTMYLNFFNVYKFQTPDILPLKLSPNGM